VIAAMAKGPPNGHDDPKITSLEEARRRRDAEARNKAKASRSFAVPAGRPLRDLIIGGLFVLAAIGTIVAYVGPLLGFNFLSAP